MATKRIARVTHAGQTRETDPANFQAVLDEMIETSGQNWDPATTKIEVVEVQEPEPSPFTVPVGRVDPTAAERINAQQETLKEAGFKLGGEFYTPGTRMMDVGHKTMSGYKAKHDQLKPLSAVLAEIEETIAAEKRVQRRITSGQLGKLLSINGKLKVDGYKVQEQALRNLLARLESPALGYILGMRERIAGRSKLGVLSPNGMQLDKAALLETLQHECEMNPDLDLVLRLRDGLGDCFTIVTPDYTVADAPSITPQFRRVLDGGTKASWTYDPQTTSWEIRAETFTPTDVQKMAVGEPFQAYSSFSGGDGGVTALWSGGGFLLIRCLNATTYLSELENARRVHRGRVLQDIPAMVKGSLHAIETAIKAWGIAREAIIPSDVQDAGKLVSIESVIPGYYRHMLTARRGELVGVLPGRTETHVTGLHAAYLDQRRNPTEITRADLANGYTKFIQDQPVAVRRNAEAAIGSWLVSAEPVKYAAPARS